MDNNPLTAVRESRERISAAVDHDPEKLVERCRKIEEQYKNRLTSPIANHRKRKSPVEPAEPAARRE